MILTVKRKRTGIRYKREKRRDVPESGTGVK